LYLFFQEGKMMTKRMLIVAVAMMLCWPVLAFADDDNPKPAPKVQAAAVPVPVIPADIKVANPLPITDEQIAVFKAWRVNSAAATAEVDARSRELSREMARAKTNSPERNTAQLSAIAEQSIIRQRERAKLPEVSARSHEIGAVGRLAAAPPDDQYSAVALTRLGKAGDGPILALDGTVFWFKGEGSHTARFHDIQNGKMVRMTCFVQVVDVLTVPAVGGGEVEVIVLRFPDIESDPRVL
jgi:hypothetical protein